MTAIKMQSFGFSSEEQVLLMRMTRHCPPLLYICACAYAQANLQQKLKSLQVPLLLLKEEPFETLQIQILTHNDVKGDRYKSIAYVYKTATGQVMKSRFN